VFQIGGRRHANIAQQLAQYFDIMKTILYVTYPIAHISLPELLLFSNVVVANA